MASVRNPNRTDAPDPVMIDDVVERSLQDRGIPTSGPGYAKLPGAEMIVANPAYYDARDAQYQRQMAGQKEPAQSTGTPAYRGQRPPRRPQESSSTGSDPSQGGFVGGAKYASLDQPPDDGGFTGGAKQAGFAPDDTGGFTGGARYAYSPQGPQQTGTPEQQGPNDYTIPYVVGGGAGLVLTALAAKAALEKRKMQLPPEAQPPATPGQPVTPDDYPTRRMQQLAEDLPERRGSVDPGADAYEPTGRMQEMIDPAAFKEPVGPTPEARRPAVENPPAGEAPASRRVGEAPQSRLGQPTWDQPKGSVPDGGAEIPGTRGSQVQETLAKSLAEAAPTVRGGGTRLRVPRIGR